MLTTNVGGTGSASDAQTYNDYELRECAEDPDPMPNDYQDVPYFFIGDDAFALRPIMMKPYSLLGLTNDERIFNYRLSRVRRVVENSFGILRTLLKHWANSPVGAVPWQDRMI